MSTRANIKIQDGINEIWLYRHWDGYPAVAGKDFYDTVITLHPQSSGFDVANAFLGHVNNGERVYELAPNRCKSAQYIYFVKCTPEGIKIGYAGNSQDWLRQPIALDLYTFEEFAAMVNANVESFNRMNMENHLEPIYDPS